MNQLTLSKCLDLLSFPVIQDPGMAVEAQFTCTRIKELWVTVYIAQVPITNSEKYAYNKNHF